MGKVASIFGGAPKTPALPPPPPPPPTREDPAIAEAARKQRLAEKQRKGRASLNITGGEGVMGDPASVDRPMARGGSQLLGQVS
jgi:hypothetical protein